MFKNIKLTRAALLSLSLVLVGGLFTKVHAQTLLPPVLKDIQDLFANGGVAGFISSRVQLGIVLFLAVLVLMAVVYAGLAAFRYVRSQGEQGEIEGAQKSIQAIFTGIAVLIIGMVGIVVVFLFFGVDFINPNIYETCISAPGSRGCLGCKFGNNPLAEDFDTQKYQTSYFGSAPSATDIPNETNYQNICTYCEWAYFQRSEGNAAAATGAFTDLCTE